jgi:glutamyl-Q tRNA(Asp) synthetase
MKQAPNAKAPVFRFAPSPNGLLHLGHAYSALLNLKLARASGGRMLLRIEDIDEVRCTRELEARMLQDLEWLGFEWDEPPRRQSEHFDIYAAALDRLRQQGLIYPSFVTRSQLRALSNLGLDGRPWPSDPDGAPFNPAEERRLGEGEQHRRMAGGEDHALRLMMAEAFAKTGGNIAWSETGGGRAETIAADPLAWGDVVLARKDAPASYHLACVCDDGLQGVTHVVRGMDLFLQTAIHRLLQELLGVAVPTYHHHRLILAEDGRKLSKSRNDTSVRSLRENGVSPSEIRRAIGLEDQV